MIGGEGRALVRDQDREDAGGLGRARILGQEMHNAWRLVVPPGLVKRLADIATLLQPPPTALIQATIAAFLEQGLLARHIRRMRQLYAERRAALAAALREHVRPALGIDLQPGGMHLLARLPRGTNDIGLVAWLTRQGVAPAPLSACGVEAPCSPGLLIGFTNVDARKAAEAARRLADALGSTHRPNNP